MSAHENLEHAEHAEHASHSNKKIALLISVLALFLRFPKRWAKARKRRRLPTTLSPPTPGISSRPRPSGRQLCVLRPKLWQYNCRQSQMKTARQRSPNRSKTGAIRWPGTSQIQRKWMAARNCARWPKNLSTIATPGLRNITNMNSPRRPSRSASSSPPLRSLPALSR